MIVYRKVETSFMTNVVALPARKRKPPNTVNRKVLPKRVRNLDLRTREYLTPEEVGRLIDQAGRFGRHRQRDVALLTLAYRHALRVSELVALRWDMVDLKQGLLHVKRLKNGIASVHPLRGPELRLLRKMARQYSETPYIFVTERKGPLTPDTVRKIISRAGEAARLGFPVHPHMLRHACGYKLANEGHDTRSIQHYLGHKNIQHTVRYTELSPARFKNFWRD